MISAHKIAPQVIDLLTVHPCVRLLVCQSMSDFHYHIQMLLFCICSTFNDSRYDLAVPCPYIVAGTIPPADSASRFVADATMFCYGCCWGGGKTRF